MPGMVNFLLANYHRKNVTERGAAVEKGSRAAAQVGELSPALVWTVNETEPAAATATFQPVPVLPGTREPKLFSAPPPCSLQALPRLF